MTESLTGFSFLQTITVVALFTSSKIFSPSLAITLICIFSVKNLLSFSFCASNNESGIINEKYPPSSSRLYANSINSTKLSYCPVVNEKPALCNSSRTYIFSELHGGFAIIADITGILLFQYSAVFFFTFRGRIESL